jgi:hypothetical protein
MCPRGIAEAQIGFAFSHALRRLHGEIPINYRVSALLYDDTSNADDLLAQIASRKPTDVTYDSRWEMTVMLHASRAILSLDVDAIDFAAKHAIAALSAIRGKSPSETSGVVIPAAAALAMRVFLHLGNTVAIEECKNTLRIYSGYVPVARTWVDLVPLVFDFAQEHHISVDSPTSDDDFNWNEAAAQAGLLFDDDLGLFLGLTEPISPRML